VFIEKINIPITGTILELNPVFEALNSSNMSPVVFCFSNECGRQWITFTFLVILESVEG
jgi:hypothetical protein